MKLENFNASVARDIIKLWEKHLGFWHRGTILYRKYPELLVTDLQNPAHWITGRYEYRLGSKYTEDSKLLAYLKGGGLEFECYAQAYMAFGEDKKKKAEEAEDAFNKAVKDYLNKPS